MEYFDRERSLHQNQSRGSNASGSQGSKTRVGGGGTISKPPRQSSKQLASSKPNLGDPMNISGVGQQQAPSEGSRRSKASAKSSHPSGNGEQPLPNLLKNSRGSGEVINNRISGRSLQEGAPQQPGDGG